MSSREYFETVAGEWDAIRQRLFPDSLRERAYGVAGIEPGRRAVDVGAGSGFLTEGLLAQGLSVVAVDEAEAMLATLGGKLGDRPGLELRAGGAERLPLADGEVDYAFANMVLHHVEEPAAAVREMARVVRPGGRVVITDLDEHDF
ncbi:MAG TPA: class I SAM-dependent methyltransferase, partial [Thermoanaerobaculia bacterium]|nr:class I SAM-dependent methyltransferase [Thermoanaerobaculia bacterium]